MRLARRERQLPALKSKERPRITRMTRIRKGRGRSSEEHKFHPRYPCHPRLKVFSLASAKKRSPRLRTRAAAAKNQFNPKNAPYGLGAPGMVFGRVARWTISPTIGTNQPKTTTSVLFGDWRRAESFMIQIAIQSQMATEIRIGINITPQAAAKIPAAALSLSSIGVALAVASSWARRAVAVKNSGRQEMSRFIRGLITNFRQRVSTQ